MYERDSIFNLMEIQVGRQLDEDEIRRINFIIKSRAYRFVAAAEQEWLYPEQHLPKRIKWGRLRRPLPPLPRPARLHYGGETIMGYEGGGSMSRDAFGRTPLNPDYGKDSLPSAGKDPLGRFKGEFAQLFGRRRRSRGWNEPEEDSEALHEHHLSPSNRSPEEGLAPPWLGNARAPRR